MCHRGVPCNTSHCQKLQAVFINVWLAVAMKGCIKSWLSLRSNKKQTLKPNIPCLQSLLHASKTDLLKKHVKQKAILWAKRKQTVWSCRHIRLWRIAATSFCFRALMAFVVVFQTVLIFWFFCIKTKEQEKNHLDYCNGISPKLPALIRQQPLPIRWPTPSPCATTA